MTAVPSPPGQAPDTRERLAAAIATIEFSRQTHVEWAAHLRQHPEQQPTAIGDAEYHEKAVREYDNVLAVLRDFDDCGLDRCPHYVAAIGATVAAGDARVAALVREGQAEAWDEGHAAAQLDANEEPYSDRPEHATWQPRHNPHRAPFSRGETGR